MDKNKVEALIFLEFILAIFFGIITIEAVLGGNAMNAALNGGLTGFLFGLLIATTHHSSNKPDDDDW